MAGMCHTLSEKFPFRQVLFHGLVMDSQGRKMSKSIGNVIDPMDLFDSTTLNCLENRIKESNLDDKEKKLSIKNQKLFYPNGIPQVGFTTKFCDLYIESTKVFSNQENLECIELI